MFVNETGLIGQILASGTITLTGSMVLSLLVIFLILLVIAMMLQIQLEYLSVIILPFCLALGSYYSTFVVPVIIIIIYLSAIVAKNWLFR